VQLSVTDNGCGIPDLGQQFAIAIDQHPTRLPAQSNGFRRQGDVALLRQAVSIDALYQRLAEERDIALAAKAITLRWQASGMLAFAARAMSRSSARRWYSASIDTGCSFISSRLSSQWRWRTAGPGAG
jgi:hypothetical protein